MKSYKTIYFLLMFFLIGHHSAEAQDSDLINLKYQVDSLQRISLRDSLNFNDSTITAIYSIRDALLDRIEILRQDQGVDDSLKEIMITDLKNQSNENIKLLLGDQAYQNYLAMIRTRTIQSINPDQSPLAGETDDN